MSFFCGAASRVSLVSLVSLLLVLSAGCAPKSSAVTAPPTAQQVKQHADHQKALTELKKAENR